MAVTQRCHPVCRAIAPGLSATTLAGSRGTHGHEQAAKRRQLKGPYGHVLGADVSVVNRSSLGRLAHMATATCWATEDRISRPTGAPGTTIFNCGESRAPWSRRGDRAIGPFAPPVSPGLTATRAGPLRFFCRHGCSTCGSSTSTGREITTTLKTLVGSHRTASISGGTDWAFATRGPVPY